ncbi:MAG TPA: hypothetical protein VHX87_02285 [Galbitalea sp.]|nr:hypothetical protein [Galbitalea sp.]
MTTSTGGSLKALCADTAEPGLIGDSAATRAEYLAWWNKVAADAPPPIRDKAMAIDNGLKTHPDAVRRLLDSYPSPFPSDTLNTDVRDFDGWAVTNCPD